MQEHEYKARDKTVQKMSRDGLREENLRSKKERRITGREADEKKTAGHREQELDFGKARKAHTAEEPVEEGTGGKHRLQSRHAFLEQEEIAEADEMESSEMSEDKAGGEKSPSVSRSRLRKVMKKVLMVMLSATMLIGSASVTAFAQANENAEQTEATEQVIEEQPAEQPATEGTPFSTPGNGQLVDDKENDSTKQFLTVQTKNGNTFYMVIDRSGTSENVYMMSLVDENDLAEFLDETKETEKKEESAVVLPETTTTPEPETTAQPETEVKQESGINKTLGYIALGAVIALALGGLGMFAFGKLRKKKEDGIVEEGLEFADDSYINEDEENAENQQK